MFGKNREVVLRPSSQEQISQNAQDEPRKLPNNSQLQKVRLKQVVIKRAIRRRGGELGRRDGCGVDLCSSSTYYFILSCVTLWINL